MKYVQAAVAIGLFGWLGFAVYSGVYANANGTLVGSAVERFGTSGTAVGLVLIGVAFAAVALTRKPKDA